SLFEMSYEAVAHRVCNLADPKRPGIPMHFVRCDVAGNISKRYSATGLRFPEGTGSCAKWAVHNAFLTPSVIARQYIVIPVGVTCRFCERTDCNQRAAPSYKFAFNVDEYTKKDNFFSPLMEHEGKP